ncbi:unnamed protein product [Boreogadus saida]
MKKKLRTFCGRALSGETKCLRGRRNVGYVKGNVYQDGDGTPLRRNAWGKMLVSGLRGPIFQAQLASPITLQYSPEKDLHLSQQRAHRPAAQMG